MNQDNKNKIILDLCGGTGSWSKHYKDAGYKVYNITLPEFDVGEICINKNNLYLKEKYQKRIILPIKKIYGILAAPPCTMFSFARTNAKTPRNLKLGMSTVNDCLRIIWQCQYNLKNKNSKNTTLKFWALENPNGFLKYFLGKPTLEFNPYDYGDQYQKRTHLWGWFNEPKKKPIKLDPKLKELHKTNSQPLPKFDHLLTKEIHPEFYGKLNRQERRAITPRGFAKSFFEANQ